MNAIVFTPEELDAVRQEQMDRGETPNIMAIANI